MLSQNALLNKQFVVCKIECFIGFCAESLEYVAQAFDGEGLGDFVYELLCGIHGEHSRYRIWGVERNLTRL